MVRNHRPNAVMVPGSSKTVVFGDSQIGRDMNSKQRRRSRRHLCRGSASSRGSSSFCLLLRDKQTRPRMDGRENKPSLRLQPLDPHFRKSLAAFLKSLRFIKYLPDSAGKVSGNAGVISGQAGDASRGPGGAQSPPASINLRHALDGRPGS